MKKLFISICMTLLAGSIFAQPPGGGRGQGSPRGQGREGRAMPPRGEMGQRTWIEKMPEIPDITLEQREKLGTQLGKELEEIEKQMSKKRQCQIKLETKTDLSQKEKDKCLKEMAKADQKILDIRKKSDQKIGKFLTKEQFAVFLSKRDDFKVRKSPHPNSENMKGEFPRQRPGNPPNSRGNQPNMNDEDMPFFE